MNYFERLSAFLIGIGCIIVWFIARGIHYDYKGYFMALFDTDNDKCIKATNTFWTIIEVTFIIFILIFIFN